MIGHQPVSAANAHTSHALCNEEVADVIRSLVPTHTCACVPSKPLLQRMRPRFLEPRKERIGHSLSTHLTRQADPDAEGKSVTQTENRSEMEKLLRYESADIISSAQPPPQLPPFLRLVHTYCLCCNLRRDMSV